MHAVTATTDGHAYAYDAAGNVSCRATAAGGCSGPSPTGAVYTYDNEGRLASWANKPSGATASASELYDGSGERVERQTTSSGVLTNSVYVGSLAEYDTTGGTTTTTDYFAFAGRTIAIYDTAWHYLVADQLGSPVVQLNTSGTPELVALKLPYGSGRYAAASLANLGFTGQRKDTSPNLTYFHARYYDQDVGVFLSPDSVTDGPNPYAYVGGMVENATDPSGQLTTQSDLQVMADDYGVGGAIDITPFIAMLFAASHISVGHLHYASSPPVNSGPAGNQDGLGNGTVNVGSYAAALSAAGDVPLDSGLARHWGLHTTWPTVPILSKKPGGSGHGSGSSGDGNSPPDVTESTVVSATESDPVAQPAAGGAMQGGGGCCSCGCLPAPRSAGWWRDNPGVAFGGDNLSSLASFSPEYFVQGGGARILIPWEISQALSGQSFSDFDAFRIAFWQAMASNPAIASTFSASNQTDMANGFAPFAPSSLSFAGRGRYEINHIKPIAEGGSVYDLSNMEVLAPVIHVMYHQWLAGAGGC